MVTRRRWALSIILALAWISSIAVARGDYERARWDPIHFSPAIDTATNEQCLQCHAEVMDRQVLSVSPAGVEASEVVAWYQTLDTYEGPQETLHRRHLVTPLARRLMDMKCNTCHQGNDPREEAPSPQANDTAGFTLRKVVDPNTCLMCHGKFNYPAMNLPGPWHEVRETLGNTCMTCHQVIRTTRHQVNFLNADAIEEAGNQSADSCYGCHGGRAWYRISYPYPRHAWQGMPEAVPEWAEGRPSESQPRFLTESR